MSYRPRCQSLDRYGGGESETEQTGVGGRPFGVGADRSQRSSLGALDGWTSDSDVTDTSWRRTAQSSSTNRGRVLRKTGLTTSRSGELTLSDAGQTLKRRSEDHLRDPLNTYLSPTSPSTASPPADGTTVPGPILTVNSVSNPSAARRVDRAPSAGGDVSSGRRLQTPTTTPSQGRTFSSSSTRRYSFDDESQQFDWSATINLLSRLDDGRAAENTQRSERVSDRESTLPTYIRGKPGIEARNGISSDRRPSDHRGYTSDTEHRSRTSPAVTPASNDTTLPKYRRDRPDGATGSDWRSRSSSDRRGYSSDTEHSVDTRRRISPAIEPPIAQQPERRADNAATLPNYARDRLSGSSNDWRPRTSSGQRGYSSDSEDSSEWLKEQRRRMQQRLSSTSGTTRSTQQLEPVDVDSRQRVTAARRSDWQTTLPTYSRKQGTADDEWRSRTLSVQRGYSSDSEDSSDWLERQRYKLREKTSSASSATLTPTTSTMKARVVFPPPRTELERRLIDELRASQERLNLTNSTRDPRNGLYSSCSLPRPSSSTSLLRGRQSLTNGFDDRPFTGSAGRYATLSGGERRTTSRLATTSGVQRATSELNFDVDTTGHRQQSAFDTSFNKHQSLTSLRGGDDAGEPRFLKTSISRQTAASYTPKRVDQLDSRVQRSATLPRRLQSEYSYESGYSSDPRRNVSQYSTLDTGRSGTYDSSRGSYVTRPVVRQYEDADEITLRPIGRGVHDLEQPDFRFSHGSLLRDSYEGTNTRDRCVPAADDDSDGELDLYIDESHLCTSASSWSSDTFPTTTTSHSSTSDLPLSVDNYGAHTGPVESRPDGSNDFATGSRAQQIQQTTSGAFSTDVSGARPEKTGSHQRRTQSTTAVYQYDTTDSNRQNGLFRWESVRPARTEGIYDREDSVRGGIVTTPLATSSLQRQQRVAPVSLSSTFTQQQQQQQQQQSPVALRTHRRTQSTGLTGIEPQPQLQVDYDNSSVRGVQGYETERRGYVDNLASWEQQTGYQMDETRQQSEGNRQGSSSNMMVATNASYQPRTLEHAPQTVVRRQAIQTVISANVSSGPETSSTSLRLNGSMDNDRNQSFLTAQRQQIQPPSYAAVQQASNASPPVFQRAVVVDASELISQQQDQQQHTENRGEFLEQKLTEQHRQQQEWLLIQQEQERQRLQQELLTQQQQQLNVDQHQRLPRDQHQQQMMRQHQMAVAQNAASTAPKNVHEKSPTYVAENDHSVITSSTTTSTTTRRVIGSPETVMTGSRASRTSDLSTSQQPVDAADRRQSPANFVTVYNSPRSLQQAGSDGRPMMISADDYTIKQSELGGAVRVDGVGSAGQRGGGGGTDTPSSASSAASWRSPAPATNGGTQQRFSTTSSGGTAERSSVELGNESSVGRASPFLDGGIEAPDLQQLTIKFVKDTSKIWYQPELKREEAVSILSDARPGSFIVRKSSSSPGAYALAIRVAQLPPNKSSKGPEDLVRNFLIESSPKGVRVKGSKSEPVFGSLAALIYQHTITPITLPCKLVLPVIEESGARVNVPNVGQADSKDSILQKGAACMVVYINAVDVETLTGPAAIERAVNVTMETLKSAGLTTTLAHFKLSSQGVTITDNKRRLFFRRHYNMNNVTYCGLLAGNRRWTQNDIDGKGKLDSRMFGFVSRKPSGSNECHVLAEYEPEQPAVDIVDFVQKVIVSHGGEGAGLLK